ncbi:hypothetical protein Hanom_Chr02g00139701 [Helianthus anomalus]
MVRVRHFEFVYRMMHIEPSVTQFRVFHQMHCSQGFYSFMQRASSKKILLQPPKSFHDWKQKFFIIKVGVIPMKLVFRGKEETATETIQTPHLENWYQDLKDVPLIALPEKALVGAAMSLCWRMNREDKPVYMEGDKGKIWGLPGLLPFLALCWLCFFFLNLSSLPSFAVVSLYVVAFEREGGKMATIPKKPDEELWYHRIARNFVFPRDEDLTAQPSSSVGMRRSSDSWCDYVVVSDSLGLAPAVVRRPKSEPRDTADIPPSNPDDPIDLDSSPKRLLRKKAGKGKQTDAEVEGPPVKKVQRKKIARIEKPSSLVPAEPSSVVNEELPPSPPRAPTNERFKSTDATDNEAEKTSGAENPEAENPADVAVDAKKITSPEVVDVGVGNPQTPEFAAGDLGKGNLLKRFI